MSLKGTGTQTCRGYSTSGGLWTLGCVLKGTEPSKYHYSVLLIVFTRKHIYAGCLTSPDLPYLVKAEVARYSTSGLIQVFYNLIRRDKIPGKAKNF
jgi:hypothetical protein